MCKLDVGKIFEKFLLSGLTNVSEEITRCDDKVYLNEKFIA